MRPRALPIALFASLLAGAERVAEAVPERPQVRQFRPDLLDVVLDVLDGGQPLVQTLQARLDPVEVVPDRLQSLVRLRNGVGRLRHVLTEGGAVVGGRRQRRVEVVDPVVQFGQVLAHVAEYLLGGPVLVEEVGERVAVGQHVLHLGLEPTHPDVDARRHLALEGLAEDRHVVVVDRSLANLRGEGRRDRSGRCRGPSVGRRVRPVVGRRVRPVVGRRVRPVVGRRVRPVVGRCRCRLLLGRVVVGRLVPCPRIERRRGVGGSHRFRFVVVRLVRRLGILRLAPVRASRVDGVHRLVPVAHGGGEVVVGRAGREIVVGRAGRDLVVGRAGRDLVVGRAGRDLVVEERLRRRIVRLLGVLRG
ncbi:calcium-binding protein [Haloplanus salinarum]|uniref:calcium-binding protein n=1 Tax=Haloplanus salinarum TaxID=1912324 RepID=UPI003B43BA7F